MDSHIVAAGRGARPCQLAGEAYSPQCSSFLIIALISLGTYGDFRGDFRSFGYMPSCRRNTDEKYAMQYLMVALGLPLAIRARERPLIYDENTTIGASPVAAPQCQRCRV